MLEDLHCAIDLCEVTVGHVLGWLVADTKLEAGGTPVDELNGALCLEGSDSAVGVLRHNISTVEQAGRHVFAVAWVTLDHLAVGLEAGHSDLLHRVGFVSRLGSRDDGGIGDKRKVDTWIWDQVGLEFIQVDVQRAIETERGSDGGDDWTASVKSPNRVRSGFNLERSTC